MFVFYYVESYYIPRWFVPSDHDEEITCMISDKHCVEFRIVAQCFLLVFNAFCVTRLNTPPLNSARAK